MWLPLQSVRWLNFRGVYLRNVWLPWWLSGKDLPAMQETWVRSLCWEDPLEKGMASHSGILAWRIPWIELQPMALQRVGHDQVSNSPPHARF